jgi:hypothetical protein
MKGRIPDYQLDPPEWFNTSYEDDEDEQDGEEYDPAWDYADEDRADLYRED